MSDLTWRRPISTWWWLRKRTYFVFVMRELSSLFVGWFVLYLLLFFRAVGRGDAAYHDFLDWAASPVVVVINVVGTVVARFLGYRVGGNTVVRCRRGHLFTTLWIPGASMKSIRLGWWRVQRCPVGNHWSLVVPVR